MSDTVISVEGLSKRYLLGAAEKAGSFREAVGNMVTAPWRKLRRIAAGGGSEEFWALKDVSFEVKRGEVVGVIGRNGAGKSTLLKVLSRITPPTAGRIRLKGRVASLLEVGTGFHPELTGRENIYLNGAILGMSTAEIRRKFDEIVAFSEVERFLDTPVKRYSSGMYVRLAFAVAAHLEPEILIVDEVLAVGDAAFQKKCLGKMKEVSTGEGRTVLFVSHNMAAVRGLCTHGVLLRDGSVEDDGDISDVLRTYLSGVEASVQADLLQRTDRRGRGRVRLARCEIMGDGDVPHCGGRLTIEFTLSKAANVGIVFSIYDETGQAVCHFSSKDSEDAGSDGYRAATTYRCQLDELLLLPGRYRINVAIHDGHDLEDHLEGAAVFHVEGGIVRGVRVKERTGWGSVIIPHRWHRSNVFAEVSA